MANPEYDIVTNEPEGFPTVISWDYVRNYDGNSYYVTIKHQWNTLTIIPKRTCPHLEIEDESKCNVCRREE